MRFSDLKGIFNSITETVPVPTVATTGNTDAYFTCKYAGELLSAYFIATDALAQHGSNYITASLTNLGQAGAGTTVMLAATDANTTKTTTGAAVAAHTQRALTLTGTAASLIVAKNDRLRIRFAATGTLGNTVTGGVLALVFKRYV
jgi:hypothetical protein